MRAVTVDEYGATPTLGEVPTPQPGAGQILIKLRAAGTNPMDRSLSSGAWKPAPGTFPMVLGADGAGVVEAVGDGETKFDRGEDVFGQFLIPPIGSTGTYAEYVAVDADAPVARVPDGLDDVSAAALPTAGGSALALCDLVEPLSGKTVLIMGAGGGIGSYATQLAANAGARVIANVRTNAAERLRGYGAAETIDHTEVSVPDAVRTGHPDRIDALIDPVSDAKNFAELASLVRSGGTAVTTQYVADVDALAKAGVGGVNFNFSDYASGELLARLAEALVSGQIVAPPITRITLDEAAARMSAPPGHADGKTVIAL